MTEIQNHWLSAQSSCFIERHSNSSCSFVFRSSYRSIAPSECFSQGVSWSPIYNNSLYFCNSHYMSFLLFDWLLMIYWHADVKIASIAGKIDEWVIFGLVAAMWISCLWSHKDQLDSSPNYSLAALCTILLFLPHLDVICDLWSVTELIHGNTECSCVMYTEENMF